MKFLKSSVLLALLAVFAIGCGNSDNSLESFVFTGNDAQVTNTGNLTFQFVNPQALEVSDQTSTIRFDIYNGPNGTGTLLFTQTEAFNAIITLLGVSTEAQSVVISTFDANGDPIGTVGSEVTVEAGVTTEVDLSNATVVLVTISGLTATPNPLTLVRNASGSFDVVADLSNQTQLLVAGSDLTFDIANDSIANVTSAGVFTGIQGGNTTVDINYQLNGSAVQTQATIIVTDPR